MVVSMPTTPSLRDLNFVSKETKVEGLLPTSTKMITLYKPNKLEVIQEIDGCQILHFACHGQSSLVDLSRSHLNLEDWQSNPLTVADIAALKLNHAFLSTCHTAD
jgi:CHAT domain-containing protein